MPGFSVCHNIQIDNSSSPAAYLRRIGAAVNGLKEHLGKDGAGPLVFLSTIRLSAIMLARRIAATLTY